MEAMWTRFQPAALEIAKIAQEGSLGKPVLVHADLSGDFGIESKWDPLSRTFGLDTHNTPLQDLPLTHRILDPALGGGALLDLCVELYCSYSNEINR